MGGSSSKGSFFFSFSLQEFEVANSLYKNVANEPETELYWNCMETLEKANELLQDISNYCGCQHLIRQAISAPNNQQLKEKVFAILLPNINITRNFYEVAKQIEIVYMKLLVALVDRSSPETTEYQLALFKCLADVIVFAIVVDRIKVVNTGIQNDFSYFRRSLMTKNDDTGREEMQANMISLFIAESNPMMALLIKATHFKMGENPDVSFILADLANFSCRVMKQKRSLNQNSLYFMRAMTGAILLYDHSANSIGGVYSKRSPIKIKRCVEEIISSAAPGSIDHEVDNNSNHESIIANQQQLLSAIQYSSRFFKEKSSNRLRKLIQKSSKPLSNNSKTIKNVLLE